ncbi:MAG: hypothetical protein OEL83_19895 [Desulforhopalus sp.]|nr:hypothetical protein [Desulforhopalus sp.]
MKPESHKNITNLAIGIYTKFASGGKLALALQDERLLKATWEGSMDEDNISPSRGLNWHFFPSNTTIANGEISLVPIFFPNFKLRPTSLFWITKRQGDFLELIQDGASKHLFSTFGRILHHIQDMSTPSHVVPVYHGPSMEDSFENYLTMTSPVNHWEAIEKRLQDMQGYFDAVLSGVATEDFTSLYNKAAHRVLSELQAPLNLFPVVINNDYPDAKVSSDAFWLFYDGQDADTVPLRIKGFGRFGHLGKKFGVCTTYNVQGKDIKIMPSVFEDIAVHYMKSAVEDSLRALKYFDQNLE